MGLPDCYASFIIDVEREVVHAEYYESIASSPQVFYSASFKTLSTVSQKNRCNPFQDKNE